VILNPRQQEILRHVRTASGESLQELCERFGVSVATMRRDLAKLEELGLLRRVRGGALPPGQDVNIPLPEDRETQHLEEKRRIAEAAAAMVTDGSIIMLDAGTTTKQMIPYLAERRNLTVLTRDLLIANRLTDYPQITTIFVGGTVQRSGAVAGSLALRFLEQFYVDQMFLGVLGVSASTGIWTANGEEALVKLDVMRRGRLRVILADGSKVGRTGGTLVAPAGEAHVLITDSSVPASEASAFEQLGLTVKLV